MNSRIINLILVTVLLVGFSLLAYPTFSDYWNSFHQSRAIASYAEDIVNIEEERYEEILSRAREWNEWIADGSIVKEKQLTEEEIAEYEELLDPLGSGMTEDFAGFADYSGTEMQFEWDSSEAWDAFAVQIVNYIRSVNGEPIEDGTVIRRVYPEARYYTDVNGQVTFKVVGTEILEGWEADELRSDEWGLSLFTCTLRGNRRIAVRCLKEDSRLAH